MRCAAVYNFPYFYNFGDAVNALIFQKLSNCATFNHTSDIMIAGTGSILHILHHPRNRRENRTPIYRSNFVVWGSGLNPNSSPIPSSKNMIIKALRGKLTHKLLKDYGIHVPENVPYGDPALLIDKMLPPVSKKIVHDLCIIPHFNDINDPEIKSYVVILPSLHFQIVWRKIAECNFIVSSSLHGIVFADVMRKKVRWLTLNNSRKTEGFFKYCDYFSGSRVMDVDKCMQGKGLYRPASTIKQALSMGHHPFLEYNQSNLLSSFPHEYIKDCTRPTTEDGPRPTAGATFSQTTQCPRADESPTGRPPIAIQTQGISLIVALSIAGGLLFSIIACAYCHSASKSNRFIVVAC